MVRWHLPRPKCIYEPHLLQKNANPPRLFFIFFFSFVSRNMADQQLYGIDAEIKRKLDEKRDLKWEAEVLEWVSSVTGASFSSSDVYQCLYNGVALCKLINTLVPNTIQTFNEAHTIRSPLQEVENIQIYLKGCWKLGVSDCFTVSDLHKAKSIGLVVSNVASLCRTAVSLGWKGKALGPIQTGENAVRKWTPVDTAPQYRHTDDAGGGSDFERALGRMQMELAEATQEMHRLTAIKMNLVEELRGLKEAHESERSKLKAKIEEIKSKSVPLASSPPVREDAAVQEEEEAAAAAREKELRDAWMKAAEESAGEVQRKADAMRVERDAEEAEANRLGGKVANLAAKKATLEEKAKALEEKRKMLLEQKAKLGVENRKPPSSPSTPVQQSALSPRSPAGVQLTPGGTLRPVKNAMGFYYTATAGTDPEKLEQLQDSIRDLMLSRKVDFPVVSLLASEFKQEAGRRVFGVCLKILLKRRRAVELSNDSFELLLFLINTSLVHMDLKQASDFLTGRVFLSAANKIFRRVDGHEDLVFNYVRDHPLWRSEDFWEEHFWRKEVSRVKKMGTSMGLREAAVSMTYNAHVWGIPHPLGTSSLLQRLIKDPEEYAKGFDELTSLIPTTKK